VNWAITDNPLMNGDGGTLYTRTEVQVSVWELSSAEDGTVKAAVVAALDGVKLDNRRLKFMSSQRLEEDGDLIHTPISFSYPTSAH